MDIGEGVRCKPRDDSWKFGNMFAPIAPELDTSGESEDDVSEDGETNQDSEDSENSDNHSEGGEASKNSEDSEDSAIHSEEEDQPSPQPTACQFCDLPVGNLPSAVRQHLEEAHTLPEPQAPTTSPTKFIRDLVCVKNAQTFYPTRGWPLLQPVHLRRPRWPTHCGTVRHAEI